MYVEENYLQLSGLQHFVFCRRQWALIHIENQWAENFRTMDGQLMHEHVHDQEFRESRGNSIIVRGLAIHSARLGISGQCDAVEFSRSPDGISLSGREGLWSPFPIEYKRGRPKEHNADELQLCAQAICLEEMLCCEIPKGALFYGETRRRVDVSFTPEMRQCVMTGFDEMHRLYRRGYTPKVKPTKSCNACSLKELCLPRMLKTGSVDEYMHSMMEDAP